MSGIKMWPVIILSLMFAGFAQADALTPAQADAVQASLTALCPLLQEEQFLTLSIAEERKNPAGVIDLAKLHSLGEELGLTRHAIQYVRVEHKTGLRLARKVIHKDLDAGFCSAWLAAQPAVE